jgi:hypothetical protein
MPLNRAWLNSLVDDSGAGLDGTIWNKAEIGSFHDVIDAALAPLEAIPLHAGRHAAGGADPVNVTLLGGFPGGTALFLRGDGAFAVPPAGAIAGDIVMTTDGAIRRNTTDGADTGYIALSGGGGGATPARGGDVTVCGNELAGFPGVVRLRPGQVAGSYVSIERTDGNFALLVDGTSGIVTMPYGLGSTPLNAANLTGTIAVARLPAHATTHNAGGSDPITAISGAVITTGTIANARLSADVLRVTGGYPGGTSLFLRADGTFAVPPGGGGGPHAATHAVGGGDTVSVLTLGGFPGGTTTFLRADGTFATPAGGGSGTPGGATTQVQFNDAGAFGGDAGLTYNKATGALTVVGFLRVGTTPAAAAGHVRLPNNSGIAWRNAANTADLLAVSLGTDNVLRLAVGCPYTYYSAHLYPSPDATLDCGDPTLRWRNGHFSGTLNAAAGLGATPLNATNLTSGTIPDARLSVNVARRDQSNVFAAAIAFSGDFAITRTTSDGADNGHLYLTGAGGADASRGAYIDLCGNETPSGGSVVISFGTAAASGFACWTGAGWNAFSINNQGGLISGTTQANGWVFNSSAADGGYFTFQRSSVAVGYIGPAKPLSIPTGTNDDFAIYAAKAGAKLFLEALGGAGGSIRSNTLYADSTPSGAANVVVESDGRIRRTTSSVRYKTAIEPLTDWRWLLDLAPVTFEDRQQPGARRSAGLLAEDVAAHGPRAYDQPIFAGLDADARPEDVAYTSLLAPMIVALQELTARIAALETKG